MLLIALGIVGIRGYRGKRAYNDVRPRAPDARRPNLDGASRGICSREPPVVAKDAA